MLKLLIPLADFYNIMLKYYKNEETQWRTLHFLRQFFFKLEHGVNYRMDGNRIDKQIKCIFLFQKMDTNNDGLVTEAEFIECCLKDEDMSASMNVFDTSIWHTPVGVIRPPPQWTWSAYFADRKFQGPTFEPPLQDGAAASTRWRTTLNKTRATIRQSVVIKKTIFNVLCHPNSN